MDDLPTDVPLRFIEGPESTLVAFLDVDATRNLRRSMLWTAVITSVIGVTLGSCLLLTLVGMLLGFPLLFLPLVTLLLPRNAWIRIEVRPHGLEIGRFRTRNMNLTVRDVRDARLARNRFVPYSEIEYIRHSDYGVHLDLAGGETVDLIMDATSGPDIQELASRIGEIWARAVSGIEMTPEQASRQQAALRGLSRRQ